MREPQVVRKLRVHRMSLCAIGIPVSGPASPRARCSSDRRAAARLLSLSSSVEMKALSSRLSLAIRSRQARVSSTEEIFLAARAAESSVTVELRRLLNDFGDEVQPPFLGRGNGLVRFPPVCLPDFVGAQPLDDVEGVGHRLDPGCVHGLDLSRHLEDAVQAAALLGGLAGLQSDAGEPREAADLVVRERHVFSLNCYGKAPAERGVFPFDSGATLAYYIGHLRICCCAQK